jgi:hypothetical protein
MPQSKVQTGLLAIRQASADEINILRDQIAETMAKQEAVQAEIEQKQIELVQLDENLQQLQTELTRLEEREARLREEVAAVYEALQEGSQELHSWFHSIADLKQEKARLKALGTDPMKLYKEYQKVSENLGLLQELPESYQQQLMGYHADLKEKLEPYLVYKAQYQKLRDKGCSLPVFIAADQETAQVVWIVPLPADLETLSEEFVPYFDEFLENSVNAILKINQHPDWFFADLEEEPRNWQGFWALEMLLAYEGEGDHLEHAQELLSKILVEQSEHSTLFKQFPYQLELVELSSAAWQLGLNSKPLTSEKVVSDTRPLVQEQEPLSVRSQGWYTDEDLVSWERPLTVTSESNWTVQGRRLRTMLMNLIARGEIDGDGVPLEVLYASLPQPHADAIHIGINMLVSAEILRQQKSGKVTINPDKLILIQNLINRDITPYLQAIINEPEPVLAAANP